jgi:hypothetical protein
VEVVVQAVLVQLQQLQMVVMEVMQLHLLLLEHLPTMLVEVEVVYILVAVELLLV